MKGPAHGDSSLILAFDTSGAGGSVAALILDLSGEARVIARRDGPSAGAHTRSLLPLFGDVLAEAGAAPVDLRGIVVGTGPGTFTGVRIGVAAARAAALALGIPVVGVSSLSALAASVVADDVPPDSEPARAQAPAGASDPFDVVVPVVDARRGQVFGCVYSRLGTAAGRGESWTRVGAPFAAAPDDVPSVAGDARPGVAAERVLFVGRTDLLPSGSPGGGARRVHRDVDAAYLVLGQSRLEGSEEGVLEGRSLLAWLATAASAPQGREGPGGRSASRPRPGDLGTPEAVRPIYVRPPDADLHITKMKDPWAS